MRKTITMFVGLDLHKDQIAVAHAPSDPVAEAVWINMPTPDATEIAQ